MQLLQSFCFWQETLFLGKKTSYDKENLESKNEKTFEKYHSGWGDDYEEIGQRRNSKEDKEFREAYNNDELPNYYEMLGVDIDASLKKSKINSESLAKKTHIQIKLKKILKRKWLN